MKRVLSLVISAVLLTTGLAFAQATSTFGGRVLDQGDAVLPGATVTATNINTGVVRTTVTNAEGVYFMPGLDPGVYEVKTELSGFAPSAQERVTLAVNTTITIDFTMRLAGLEEALIVTGEAPLIEVTQSKVASSIEATELENLPMITRTVSGMLALLPGAVQIAPHHRSKENVGSVSYGGGSGTNVIPTVDGADNRDNQFGGPLLTFTTEGLEQFQLATSQFTATDGRSAGAALTILTKSGTNVLHGSGFLFARDEALNATDYFTKQANAEKVPFSRQQFGGSFGGPILRNRLFFFGAAEQVYEDTSVPVPDNLFSQHELLVAATAAGRVPTGLVNPNHPRAGAIPMSLLMYTIKSNAQLTNNHSLMGRFAGQHDNRDAVVFSQNNDNREPENSEIKMWSAVGQHSWVLGSRGLNQITGQVNHLSRLSDVMSAITGEHYTSNFPNVPIFPPRLAFPSVNTGAGGGGGTITDTSVIQIKDDVSLQMGTHALRFGANFNYLPDIGLLNGNEHFATLTFFDDPSVILSNSNGRYPQGFQTPGIVRQWQQANPVLADSLLNAKQFATWFQDDWRVTSQLTLNLGIRYDLDSNFYDQGNWENNATRLALEAIGNPYSRIPKTPDQGRLAARRIRLRPGGRRPEGAARRLWPVLRPVQHQRRERVGHLLAEQASPERPRHADQYGDRRRPAGQLPLRDRSGPGAADRIEHAAARRHRPVAESGHRGSLQPHRAHRLCPHPGGQYHGLGRLHARRGAAGAQNVEHQPDCQRPAGAGGGLPPGVRGVQLPERRPNPVVGEQVAV